MHAVSAVPDSAIAGGPELRARVEVTIGQVDGPLELVFGRITGLAVDDDGRIYVLDALASEVRVFSRNGQFIFRFGRPGSGPGDMRSPCCLAFDAGGKLWVRNEYRFLDQYEILEADALHLNRLALDIRGRGGANPLMWDADGNIRLGGMDAESLSHLLLSFDSTGVPGNPLRLPFTAPEPDSRPLWRVEVTAPSGRVIHLAVAPPFARGLMIAYSRSGGSASISGRYIVKRLAPDGTPLPDLVGPGNGPILAPEERDIFMQQVQQRRDRGERVTGINIPVRKPAVAGLWYDMDERLWVELGQSYGSRSRVADVYSPAGSILFRASWPSDIQLASWTPITGNVAIGVRKTALDVEQVVRIRFAR